MLHLRKFHLAIIVLLIILTIIPAFAQQTTSTAVTFGDLSFMLDSTVARNVNIVQFPADTPQEQYPGGPQPAHIIYTLYDDMISPEVMLQAKATIFNYSLDAMSGYTAHETELASLQALLETRPDLQDYEQVQDSLSEINLPFLPVMPAAQVIRARAEYLDMDELNGIAYVTVYRQDASPFLDYEFIYTFQGLSTDRSRYISVVMPVKATMFPNTIAQDFDYEAFVGQISLYFTDSIAALNEATVEDFIPNLTVGVELAESVKLVD